MINELDDIIEKLIRLKWQLMSRPTHEGENRSTVPSGAPQGKIYEPIECGFRMECVNGHYEWGQGAIIKCDDAINGPFYCPTCGERLHLKYYNSAQMEKESPRI